MYIEVEESVGNMSVG